MAYHLCAMRNLFRHKSGKTELERPVSRIAILEDDPDQFNLLQHWLAEKGYQVDGYQTSKAFMHQIARETYDLLILDWEIPDLPGIEVLKWLRADLSNPIPVLFATVHDSEEDLVYALDAGADDYIAKPIRCGELLARIRALLRRANPNIFKEVIFLPPFAIDTKRREILRDGVMVELTSTEFDLALTFFRNPGRLLSREYLRGVVWGKHGGEITRTVDMHVSQLRKKLALSEEGNHKLSAIPNRGYRLDWSGALE
jgi:DNA-binding response OmpR family regulator